MRPEGLKTKTAQHVLGNQGWGAGVHVSGGDMCGGCWALRDAHVQTDCSSGDEGMPEGPRAASRLQNGGLLTPGSPRCWAAGGGDGELHVPRAVQLEELPDDEDEEELGEGGGWVDEEGRSDLEDDAFVGQQWRHLSVNALAGGIVDPKV